MFLYPSSSLTNNKDGPALPDGNYPQSPPSGPPELSACQKREHRQLRFSPRVLITLQKKPSLFLLPFSSPYLRGSDTPVQKNNKSVVGMRGAVNTCSEQKPFSGDGKVSIELPSLFFSPDSFWFTAQHTQRTVFLGKKEQIARKERRVLGLCLPVLNLVMFLGVIFATIAFRSIPFCLFLSGCIFASVERRSFCVRIHLLDLSGKNEKTVAKWPWSHHLEP